MTKHRFSLGLVALFATMLAQAGPLPAVAQGISQKVAVCNPDFTGRCVKPDASGNTPVTGTVTVVPSGTQDSNLKQVNGATVNVGVGAAGTGTQRVTTSTDSTIGTVSTVTAVTAITNALPAGSAIIGKVGIDQTIPGTTNGVVVNSSALPSGAASAANQTSVQTPITPATATATVGLLLGCESRTTKPTFTNTQQGAVQCGTRGAITQQLVDADGTTGALVAANASAYSNSAGGLTTNDRLMVFNSATWDPLQSANALGTGGASNGVAAIANVPTGSQGQGIIPVVSASVESNHVIKSGSGSLFALTITTGASGGYLLVFDAISAPADGAVTPKICRVVAANATYDIPMAPFSRRFATGITAVFSTTGCFTKTASATAFFEAYAF